MRLAASTGLLLLLPLLTASSAVAQPPAPRLEATLGTWIPAPGLRLSADADGIVGSEVALQSDLGLERQPQWDLRLSVRPARRHRLTLQYLPMLGEASAVLNRDVRFVGATYRNGETVRSTLTWNTWRAGYAYTLFERDRLSLGLSVDVWQSDLRLRMRAGATDREGRSKLPIPGLGTVVHWQASPRVALTGEGSVFVIPDQPDHHFGGRYVNLWGAAAIQVTGPLALQAGLRWIDIRHLGEANTGFGRLTALTVGAVIRR